MTALDTFLATLPKYPTAAVKLADFIRAYRQHVGPEEARHWPRSRILAALAQRFPIGRRHANAVWVGGMSLDDPPRWKNDERGKLKLAWFMVSVRPASFTDAFLPAGESGIRPAPKQ